MNQSLYAQYAALKREIEALEEKRKEIAKAIMKNLLDAGLDKETNDLGTFKMAHKISWTYSDATKKLEERLKIAKIQEQKKGTAIPDDSPYLMFIPVK